MALCNVCSCSFEGTREELRSHLEHCKFEGLKVSIQNILEHSETPKKYACIMLGSSIVLPSNYKAGIFDVTQTLAIANLLTLSPLLAVRPGVPQ